jgi:SpoIIAA-like
MLAYKEYDNAQAVEIVLTGRVSTEEFDKVARKLEVFIERHGQIRVLEVIKDFEGMDAGAFWHGTIQPKACSGFQPDRHRDQSGRASSLVEPRGALHALRRRAFLSRRDGSRARLADVARRGRGLVIAQAAAAQASPGSISGNR